MLIKRDVFPDLVTAKYKTLGDEKLCLNNLHKNLTQLVMGKINRTIRPYLFTQCVCNRKGKSR